MKEIIPAGKTDTSLTISSSIMGITVRYSVYLPPGYDSTEQSYPVFYLLHGMYGNHCDWINNGMASEMNHAIAAGKAKPMVVVMPQGFNLFYCNNFNNQGFNYEDFFITEFIPSIEDKLRVKKERNNRAIGGLSMGGYGATLNAYKRPELFGSCYSMSGALPGVNGAPDIREIINRKQPGELAILPAYVMETGTEDFLVYAGNVEFNRFLEDKGIQHNFITRPGTHDWNFWMTCLPKAIAFISKYFD
ncbi:MAG: alpha/beta hydrolase-fold protein [Bacteroidales bacterium]